MSHGKKICILGLGYVGLPIAINFAEVSQVIGFDINKKRLAELKQSVDSNGEYSQAELRNLPIQYTDEATEIAAADFYIVAVPTPVDANKQPELSHLRCASETVGLCLDKGDIVVYESTVYPGATEEYCAPILEQTSGLVSGQDFFIGYSPERINPGDKQHTFSNITKVVSGQTDDVCEAIAQVYATVVHAGVYKAPSIQVAEAAKVIENTQRDLNIALMNELAIIFEKMGIDTLDVLQAAETKWNFMSFRPGLVGGHCISVDPYYLTYKASTLKYAPEVILAGRHVNDSMGRMIVHRVIKAMNKKGCETKNSIVTILGLTFKEDVPDLRNSRVVDIVRELLNFGVSLQLHDPMADPATVQSLFHYKITDLQEIQPADAVIFAVAHQAYKKLDWPDIAPLVRDNGIVFDVRGILPREHIPQHITLLRL